MKNKLSLLLILAVMICLGIGLLVICERQQSRVLCEVVWQAPHNRPKPSLIASWLRVFLQQPQQVDTFALNSSSSLPDFSSERVRNPDGTDALKVTWKGVTALGGPTLADFTFFKGLTPGAHYAVTGAIRRENMDSTCRVEMTSLIFVGTTTKEAHNANETYYEVGRNTDWQPFALLVDESKMDFSLAGFLVNLQLNGPNTVEVRNLKFVQYPDASIPPAAQATLTMPPATTLAQLSQIIAERERTYLLYGWLFILGLFVLPFGIIVFYLIRRARRIRHERELRRIASIDS